MAKELNGANALEAYCGVIACTGVGAAASNCSVVLPKIIKVTVPQEEHDTYPERLLECAKQICAGEPYGWSVEDKTPSVEDDTTFQDLFDEWFKEIVTAF